MILFWKGNDSIENLMVSIASGADTDLVIEIGNHDKKW